MQTIPKLVTIGVIAEELGEKIHRVQNVLKTRRHIRPVALAGRSRLFEQRAIAQVRHELNAIDARRSDG